VLFVHQGAPADAETFFARYWPEARAIEDRSLRLYRAFGLGRGSMQALLGWGSLKAGLRAAKKGHLGGKPSGDVRVMPGTFLVADGDRVAFAHRAAHAGDHPAEDEIRRAYAALGPR
jgi:hypothetical protein